MLAAKGQSVVFFLVAEIWRWRGNSGRGSVISQRTEYYVLQHKKREEEVKIKMEKGEGREKKKNPMNINQ